jgi:hypothetical protein
LGDICVLGNRDFVLSRGKSLAIFEVIMAVFMKLKVF